MTRPPAPPDPLYLAFQQALAGNYSIERELGRGGMGVVYLAREVHLDRLVAIKLLPPELSVRPTLRDRFLREARLAAKLSHPNIIPIHSVSETDGFVYFVMAYVEGETLTQRVHARGPVSASDGIRLLREAAWALGYAHGQGVVHRDVKPDNILIEAATGRALVADFGIAAATGDAHGEGISGTPEFMSPEQALGAEVDARSDLYSLGATAFFALSGQLPFSGVSAAQILARQVTESPPPLATAGRAVPRKLAHLVDRCLAKDPTQRPSNAQELADILGSAIEQRRELPAALRAFVKRNGRMDGGGTVLSLAASVITAVATAALVGPTAALLALAGGVATAASVFAVVSAKRLLDHGFTQTELKAAFRAERDSSREERAVHQGKVRLFIERALGAALMVLGSTSTALLALSVVTEGDPQVVGVGALALVGFVGAIASGFGFIVMVQRRRDVDTDFWSAMWSGRVGAWAFSIARKWRGAKPLGPAMTHRATELSLGMAAEELFESLPKSSRTALGDVPSLLQRLQRDAQLLRARFDAVQDGLHQQNDAATSDLHTNLRAERDVLQERLRQTVGALETIRLSMLRLHAGSLSLEVFTTHIDRAAEVSADVERLIAAHLEVEAMLRMSHDVQLTPV